MQFPIPGTDGSRSSWLVSPAFSGLSNSMDSLPIRLKGLLTCLEYARESQRSVRLAYMAVAILYIGEVLLMLAIQKPSIRLAFSIPNSHWFESVYSDLLGWTVGRSHIVSATVSG